MVHKVIVVGKDWDVVDLLESLPAYQLLGFIDPKSDNHAEIPVIGSDSDWPHLKQTYPDASVLLAIDQCSIRAELCRVYQDSLCSVVSNDAFISKRATIGEHTLIQKGVHIASNVYIGVCCKLNINAVLHHDVQIGSFCTVAPGAQLLGNVRVGDNTYIGAGAIVKQHCKIGRNVVVGAGAVVVKDVPDDAVVMGVPAK